MRKVLILQMIAISLFFIVIICLGINLLIIFIIKFVNLYKLLIFLYNKYILKKKKS
jgi:hypothetical protein